MRKSNRSLIRSLAIYLTLTCLLFLFLIPIFWMVSLSFRLPIDAFDASSKLFFKPTLANYQSVLYGKKIVGLGSYAATPSNKAFPRNLLNSLIIGVSATLLALILGAPAAYGISKFNFRGRKSLASFILSTRFVPPIAVVIPFFVLFRQARLLDTHLSLVIIYTFMNLALVIWMLVGFFDEVPAELCDAARVDGLGHMMTYMKIVMPLAAPGIAASAILCLMLSWNEFLFALILTGNFAKTAPLGVYSFVTFREIIWGNLCAAGMIATVPIVIFVLLVQKNLVRGLTAGAIK